MAPTSSSLTLQSKPAIAVLNATGAEKEVVTEVDRQWGHIWPVGSSGQPCDGVT